MQTVKGVIGLIVLLIDLAATGIAAYYGLFAELPKIERVAILLVAYNSGLLLFRSLQVAAKKAK